MVFDFFFFVFQLYFIRYSKSAMKASSVYIVQSYNIQLLQSKHSTIILTWHMWYEFSQSLKEKHLKGHFGRFSLCLIRQHIKQPCHEQTCITHCGNWAEQQQNEQSKTECHWTRTMTQETHKYQKCSNTTPTQNHPLNKSTRKESTHSPPPVLPEQT